MIVVILTRTELDELIQMAIRVEACGYTPRNIKRWRTRFKRCHESCMPYLEQFVVDVTEQELASAKSDANYIVIALKHPMCQNTGRKRFSVQKDLVSNHLLYSLSIIYVGATFEQVHSLDALRGIRQAPSERTYYRDVITITEAVQSCVETSLEKARSEIDSDRCVSYDTAWRHRRRCRQASGVLVDLVTGKVIDYYIGVVKMPEALRPQTDKWAETATRVDYKEGYPQGLEVKIFHQMTETVTKNDFIKGLVKDNEHDPGKEIKKAASGKAIYVDVNHNVKHFRSYLNKQLKEKSLARFYTILFYPMQYLLRTTSLSQEEKHQQWNNMINHIQGNHSMCRHADRYCEYDSCELSEREIRALETIIQSCDKFIDLSRPGLHTQHNESLHSLMSQLASKNVSWKSTIPARIGIAILRKNEGEEAFLQICTRLGIECADHIREYITEKADERNKQHRRDHDSENMERRNRHRSDVNKALAKPKQASVTRSRRKRCPIEEEMSHMAPEIGDSSLQDCDDESDPVFFDDSPVPEDDVFEMIFDSEYDSDSESSFVIDIDEDGLDDITFQKYLESGCFDETSELPNSKAAKLPFTGISNTHQTCFISVVLQGIAMCIREKGVELELVDDRFAKSLHECIMYLATGHVAELHINGLLRNIISFHNEHSREKLVFGRQADTLVITPSLVSLVDSWCRVTQLFKMDMKCYRRCPCNCNQKEDMLFDGVAYWEILESSCACFCHLRNSDTPTVSARDMLLQQLQDDARDLSRSYQCPKCGTVSEKPEVRKLLDAAPLAIVTGLDRLYQRESDGENRINDLCENQITFSSGLVVPLMDPSGENSILFANYVAASVICHLGDDGRGHYIIYNFSDHGIIMISDSVVRLAEAKDIDVMERRSVMIFWTFLGYSDEIPEDGSLSVTQALHSLRSGANGREIKRKLPDQREIIGSVSLSGKQRREGQRIILQPPSTN